ncbi:MAG: hypothetical protein L6Q93_06875 [Phycisphaerae bacterium]|nr:hypothetical protein [Phycisphaerae bacterium]
MPHGPEGSPQRPQPPVGSGREAAPDDGEAAAKALIFRVTAPKHCGHRTRSASLADNTSSSNSRPQRLQTYSNTGIDRPPPFFQSCDLFLLQY